MDTKAAGRLQCSGQAGSPDNSGSSPLLTSLRQPTLPALAASIGAYSRAVSWQPALALLKDLQDWGGAGGLALLMIVRYSALVVQM